MTAFEIGRVAVKTAGRETAKKCVILGFVDKNFVLVTGAGLNGVRRRSANMKHLVPINQKVSIKENSPDDEVSKAIASAGLKDEFVKEYDFTV
jgi:large subunit ribosomal protein L14e